MEEEGTEKYRRNQRSQCRQRHTVRLDLASKAAKNLHCEESLARDAKFSASKEHTRNLSFPGSLELPASISAESPYIHVIKNFHLWSPVNI